MKRSTRKELAEQTVQIVERGSYHSAIKGSSSSRVGCMGLWRFRNDPAVVAAAFVEHLRAGAWSGRFERVVFSVYDSSPSSETLLAFERAMA